MTEGLFLLLAMIATVITVYWSFVNDRRPPGTPVSGLLAYREGREPPPPVRKSARLRPAAGRVKRVRKA